MKALKHIQKKLRKARGTVIQAGDDGFAVSFPCFNVTLECIVSWGDGWEHASIKVRTAEQKTLTPNWEQMCFAKRMFFKDSECVVQFHPAKQDYVNNHPDVLHLWRCIETPFIMPPKIMV